MLSGQLAINQELKGEDIVWDNFYQKLGEITSFHGKLNQETAVTVDNMPPEQQFATSMEDVLQEADRMFSGEEGHGRYLDLHQHYLNFCNIKKLR